MKKTITIELIGKDAERRFYEAMLSAENMKGIVIGKEILKSRAKPSHNKPKAGSPADSTKPCATQRESFMAGYHYARNTNDDWDDEHCYQDWLKRM